MRTITAMLLSVNFSSGAQHLSTTVRAEPVSMQITSYPSAYIALIHFCVCP
jgi:hypothetical protein